MSISASALDEGLYEIDELYEEGESTPQYYPTPEEDLAVLSRKNGGYLVVRAKRDIEAARGNTYFLVRNGYVVAFGEKL